MTRVGPIPFRPAEVGDGPSLVGAEPIDGYDDLFDVEHAL